MAPGGGRPNQQEFCELKRRVKSLEKTIQDRGREVVREGQEAFDCAIVEEVAQERIEEILLLCAKDEKVARVVEIATRLGADLETIEKVVSQMESPETGAMEGSLYPQSIAQGP